MKVEKRQIEEGGDRETEPEIGGGGEKRQMCVYAYMCVGVCMFVCMCLCAYVYVYIWFCTTPPTDFQCYPWTFKFDQHTLRNVKVN